MFTEFLTFFLLSWMTSFWHSYIFYIAFIIRCRICCLLSQQYFFDILLLLKSLILYPYLWNYTLFFLLWFIRLYNIILFDWLLFTFHCVLFLSFECQSLLKHLFQVVLFFLWFVYWLLLVKNFINAFLTFWKCRLNLGRILLQQNVIIFGTMNIFVFRFKKYWSFASFIIQYGSLQLMKILWTLKISHIFKLNVFNANVFFISWYRLKFIMFYYREIRRHFLYLNIIESILSYNIIHMFHINFLGSLVFNRCLCFWQKHSFLNDIWVDFLDLSQIYRSNELLF